MISQGTGLLTDQIILVLILIVSRVSQPTGRQLVFIISQGLPPLAAGDRLKRRDRDQSDSPRSERCRANPRDNNVHWYYYYGP